MDEPKTLDTEEQRRRRRSAAKEIVAAMKIYGIKGSEISRETGLHPNTLQSLGVRTPSLETLDSTSRYVAERARQIRAEKRKPRTLRKTASGPYIEKILASLEKPLLST